MNLQDRTKSFAIEIIDLLKRISKDDTNKVLGRQLLRSATSVGANTRAAFRGRSNKEFVAKIGIVIEESDECAFWLELLIATEKRHQAELQKMLQEANELTAIFVSVSKTHRKQ